MLIAVCFTLFICVATYFLWHYKHRYLYYHIKQIPGPPTYPLIGNALDIGLNPVAFLKCMYELPIKYGPISRLWIGFNKVYIVISDPECFELILSSPKYLRKSVDYDILRPWLGNGLLLSTGSHWQKRRKIITPTFHFKILEEFIPIFNSASDILIQKLSKEVDKDVVDIYPYIAPFTLDVICETAMGTTVNAQQDPNNEYCTAVKAMCNIFIERAFSFWKQFSCLFKLSSDYELQQKSLKIIHDFTTSIIEQRREQLTLKRGNETEETDDIGSKKRIAFLDLLLQATIDGEPLSDEDIASEVDTFMFEGHDTTASAISFALYCIAKNPNVQNKIVDELSSIFADDMQRAPTVKDLNNMKYIECVIKETLRLYPSVPLFGRLLEEDIHYKNYLFPKDALVSIVAIHMHRNPKIYKNPDDFYPERFDIENLVTKNPFSYIPFSAGPRNCIGQKFAMYELKATIAKIVRHFELFPVDSKYDVVLSVQAVLKPINGVHINLKKRIF